MSPSTQDFTLSAGISPSGTKILNIGVGHTSLSVPFAKIAIKQAFDNVLAQHQIILTPAQRAEIIRQASSITFFPPKPYAEHAGWIDSNHYVRPDGELIAWEGKDQVPNIAFARNSEGTGRRGTLLGWRAIARCLTGQTLIQFLIMASLAGPVLLLTRRTLNILFEIVGSQGGEGKSSALYLASTTSGPAKDLGGGTRWITPNGTMNWLEDQLIANADSTNFLDEFQVFGAGSSPAARSQLIYDFVFRFSEGRTRGRYEGVPPISYRSVGLITANQNVRDLLGRRHVSLVNPSTSRLITQPGDAGFGLGTLDFLPTGERNPRSFIASLLEAAERNHGTAFPAFLQGIVRMRAQNEGALRARIARHVDTFVDQAIGGAGGLDARIAEAYAIVAVAGRLGRYLGILPKQWDPEAVAFEAYRRCLAAIEIAADKPISEVLNAYVARADVIDLDQGLPSLSDAELSVCSGFRRTRQEQMELIVPQPTITRLFADWERRRNAPEMANYLKREGQHLGIKRVVRRGAGKERLYVFSNFA